MKFITVEDLCSRSAQVWKSLKREKELVVTHNGKPIAILAATDEAPFAESLSDLRSAMAPSLFRRRSFLICTRGAAD